MEDLIFHMFFVVPLTRCITSSERPWNKANPRSGTILAVLALFLIGVVQSRRDTENYYEVLGVGPSSPPRVISAAYRKLAVQYHPDKNQHPDAKETFAKIREAYGVLMNEKRRSSYLRFGDYSKEGDVDEEQFYDILFLATFQLLVPFLLAYLYTYRSDAAPAREIFSCYVATSFALELLLRFDDRATHYLSFLPFVGDWLPFEKVQLLHSWMPVVLNGLLLLGSDLASNEDETFDEITRNAVDWRLDTLVYMERYLCAAETILKANKKMETRKRWALRVDPGETTDETVDEGRAFVRASMTRSASHICLDTDTAEFTGQTSSSSNKQKAEYRIVEGKEEQAAIRLFEQVQQEERQRRLLQTQQLPQSLVDTSSSSGDTSESGDYSSSSCGSTSGAEGEKSDSIIRLRRHTGKTDTEPQGNSLAEGGQTNPAGEEDKSLDQAVRRRMRENGYIEVLQYVKPWRLDPTVVSAEMPDLWAQVMANEMISWPDGLTEEGIATRADCTERGWDKERDRIVAMMEEADEEDAKLGHGISLGSIIFFGSLLLRCLLWQNAGK